MLILTHERADENMFDTYLLDQMFPVRPLICFGRSASASPVVKKEDAVRHWWEDFWGRLCGRQAHLREFLRKLMYTQVFNAARHISNCSYLNEFQKQDTLIFHKNVHPHFFSDITLRTWLFIL